jgi:hypothetical protein
MLKAPETREEWAAHTEPARRIARFRFARDKVRKIIDGKPELTDEELLALAALLAEAAAARARAA